MVMALFGLSVNAAAHTYFFSITELSVNAKKHNIEIIHQLTAHDIDHAIAQNQQIHFSAAHPDYENIIKQYIENKFQLVLNNTLLPLKWVGLEINKGKVIIYQTIKQQNNLAGLVVKNEILVDTYPKQINTVNYQDAALNGSLTFNRLQRTAKIASN